MWWPFDPTVYAGLLGLFLGHAWLARGRNLPRIASLYFGLGLFCIWLALETPIDTISDHYLDSVHMLQHVLLGVIAPPLLLLGLNREWPGSWSGCRGCGPSSSRCLPRWCQGR